MARASRRRRTRTTVPRARRLPITQWIEQHWLLVLIGVFVLALGWRLGYVARLSGTVLAGSLQGDARIYWDWATHLLANGFQGSNAFFLGPLYPYVLALVRAVVGSDVTRVLVVQAVWGAAATVLLTDAASRLVRRPVAAAMGAFIALYQMAVFFDGLVLMESLLFFLEALLLWLWCRAGLKSPTIATFIGVGVVTGLVALGRGVGALLIVPALWIALRAPGAVPVRSVALVAAFMLTILPATLHNWKASGEFIPLTYNAGYNLYVGNNPDATGTSVWIGGARRVGSADAGGADGGAESDGREYLKSEEDLDLSPAASSRYWMHEAGEWIHEDMGRALALAGRKALLLWNHREAAQFENADLYRRSAGPLGVPWLGTFAVLAVIGVAGFAAASSAPLVHMALRMWVLLMTLGIMPFFVTDRYRLHLVPALALLAAVGVEAFLARRRGQFGRLALPAIAAVVLVSLPILGVDSAAEEWGSARDVGTRWLGQGRADLAVAEFEKAVALEPELEARGRLPEPASRAQLYFNYGVALRRVGDQDAALRWMREAAEAEPGNPQFLRTLGDAYLVTGRTREGDSLLRLLPDIAGGQSETLLSQGYREARAGRFTEAAAAFREAVAADRRNHAAWGALIRVQVQAGAVDQARQSMSEARETGMPAHMADTYDAMVSAAAGDLARARQLLDGVPRTATDGDPILSIVRATAEKMVAEGR